MQLQRSGPPAHIDHQNILYTVTMTYPDGSAAPNFYPYDELGVTTGCGNGEFCPDDLVTRGQMAAFLIRSFAQ